MQSLFLWLNIIVAGGITIVMFRSGPGGRLGAKQALRRAWTWQLLFSCGISLSGSNPYHLFWLAAVSSLIGFCFDYEQRSKEFSRIVARFPPEERSELQDLVGTTPQVRDLLLRVASDEEDRASNNYDLSVAFCVAGERLVSEGKRAQGFQVLLFALRLDKQNPLTWVNLAEAKFAIKDRAAALWANKLLKWKPTPNMAERGWKCYTSPEGVQVLSEMRQRMREIASICSDNPEWIDSSAWIMPDALKE